MTETVCQIMLVGASRSLYLLQGALVQEVLVEDDGLQAKPASEDGKKKQKKRKGAPHQTHESVAQGKRDAVQSKQQVPCALRRACRCGHDRWGGSWEGPTKVASRDHAASGLGLSAADTPREEGSGGFLGLGGLVLPPPISRLGAHAQYGGGSLTRGDPGLTLHVGSGFSSSRGTDRAYADFVL